MTTKMQIFSRRGIRLSSSKKRTRFKSIEKIKAPEQIILPVQMHIGAPGIPIVAVGERVLLGQPVTKIEEAISSPAHSSVSGVVTAIEPRPHPGGGDVLSIVIQNDFQDEIYPGYAPVDLATCSLDAFINLVQNAGIVGFGGATFPTHAKIISSLGKVNTLIVNGAECEPFITSDHRVMLENTDDLINGIKILMKALGVKKTYLAIESNKPDVIIHFGKVLKKTGKIKVVPLPTRYPQGAEKVLIKNITGKEIPPGQLPASVGCVVFNVETVSSICRLIKTGMPIVSRVVTVSGSAVANPKNLLVPIGTPIENLIEASGGFLEDPKKVIMGGPMMGVTQHTLQVPVIKGTNAVLGFTHDEAKPVPNPACIHCGKCVRVCPMKLLPIYIYKYGEKGMLEDCKRLNVGDCIECGCCSYICPGRLHLAQSFKTIKTKLSAYGDKKKG